jgi:hypothetical protein
MNVEIIHDVAVSPNLERRDAASVCVYPASTVTRRGELLCVYRQGSAKHSRDGTLLVQQSADAGRTWSAPVTVYDGMKGEHPESVHTGVIVESAAGDVLVFFTTVEARKPDVYIFSEEGRALQQRMWLVTSPDGGRTWLAAREMDVPGLPPNRYFGSRPLVVSDGSLLLPIEVTAAEGQQAMLVSRSEDGGRSFSAALPIAWDASGRLGFGDGRLAELDDGSVVMLTWTYRHPSEESIHVHRCLSSDGGRTWSAPEPTDLMCQIPAPQAWTGSQMLAAGTVRTPPEGIRLVASQDAGRTWDAARAIQLWDPRELRASGKPLALSPAGPADAPGLWAALPSFTFGSPELMRIGEDEMVMTCYAIIDGITHVRACRFKVSAMALPAAHETMGEGV